MLSFSFFGVLCKTLLVPGTTAPGCRPCCSNLPLRVRKPTFSPCPSCKLTTCLKPCIFSFHSVAPCSPSPFRRPAQGRADAAPFTCSRDSLQAPVIPYRRDVCAAMGVLPSVSVGAIFSFLSILFLRLTCLRGFSSPHQ